MQSIAIYLVSFHYIMDWIIHKTILTMRPW
jgi:hypothetical protein